MTSTVDSRKTYAEQQAEKKALYDARPAQSEDPSLATAVREFIAWAEWTETLPNEPSSDSGSGAIEELCGGLEEQVERLKAALRDPEFFITVGGRFLLVGEKLALSPLPPSNASSPRLSRTCAAEAGVLLYRVYDDAQREADALAAKVSEEEVIVWRTDGTRMGTSPRQPGRDEKFESSKQRAKS